MSPYFALSYIGLLIWLALMVREAEAGIPYLISTAVALSALLLCIGHPYIAWALLASAALTTRVFLEELPK